MTAAKEKPAMAPLLLTVEATCAALGCSRSWLYTLIGRGDLKARKNGKRIMFARRDVEAFVDALPEATIAPPMKRSRR